MADTFVNLKISAKKLERFGEQLAAELKRRRGPRPMHEAFNGAGLVYMAFIQARYHEHSQGGGADPWAPLAESTLRRRRKGEKTQGRKRARQTRAIFSRMGVPMQAAGILMDTATLYGSLTPGRYEEEDVPGGIRVGTNVPYAEFHQNGTPRMPKREIFVQPDADTRDQIAAILEEGLQRSVNAMGGGPKRGGGRRRSK